jgi:hypothetical protein
MVQIMTPTELASLRAQLAETQDDLRAARVELLDRERPARYAPDFSPLDGAHVFIQWKGTDVCFDFYCECGAQGHYDGYFAYAALCPVCERTWKLPHSFTLIEQVADDAHRHTGVPVEMTSEEKP